MWLMPSAACAACPWRGKCGRASRECSRPPAALRAVQLLAQQLQQGRLAGCGCTAAAPGSACCSYHPTQHLQVPMIAATATATADVKKSILSECSCCWLTSLYAWGGTAGLAQPLWWCSAELPAGADLLCALERIWACCSFIAGSLKLQSPLVLHGSFNRPNIALEVRRCFGLGSSLLVACRSCQLVACRCSQLVACWLPASPVLHPRPTASSVHISACPT